MLKRYKHRREIVKKANSYEKQWCETHGLPYPGGFKSFRDLKNHLENVPEPTIWAKKLLKCCRNA